MKKVIFIFAVVALFCLAVSSPVQAQTAGARVVKYEEAIVKSSNLAAMGNAPDAYDIGVDLDADGHVDPLYSWVPVMVEMDGVLVMCIASVNMLPTTHREGRLYKGCRVQVVLLESGPRFGNLDVDPRRQEGEFLPQKDAIVGKIIAIIED